MVSLESIKSFKFGFKSSVKHCQLSLVEVLEFSVANKAKTSVSWSHLFQQTTIQINHRKNHCRISTFTDWTRAGIPAPCVMAGAPLYDSVHKLTLLHVFTLTSSALSKLAFCTRCGGLFARRNVLGFFRPPEASRRNVRSF